MIRVITFKLPDSDQTVKLGTFAFQAGWDHLHEVFYAAKQTEAAPKFDPEVRELPRTVGFNLVCKAVAESLTRGGKETKPEEVPEQFDQPSILAMYTKLREASGIPMPKPGEELATPMQTSTT